MGFTRFLRERRRRASVIVRACDKALCRPALETLEPRQLLAGNPIITEFMAANDTGGRADGDGEFSDWIEIFNPGAQPINLAGYYLTDSEGDKDRWQFPSSPLSTIPAGGHLLVWASEKDKVTATQIHTNFSLSTGVNYLALVAPDADTVVYEFDGLPEQLRRISYGQIVNTTSSSLISNTGALRYTVPAGPVNPAWTQPDFDDSTWGTGLTGVGYDMDNVFPRVGGFAVKMVDTASGLIGNIGNATALLDGQTPAGFTIAYAGSQDYAAINFGGSGGSFGGDSLLPNGLGTASDSVQPGRTEYALRAGADVFIPNGTYTINVASLAGFYLDVDGVTFTSRTNQNFSGVPFDATTQPADTMVFGGIRNGGDTFGTFTVDDASGGVTTTLRLDYFEGNSVDYLEMSLAPGAQSSFSPAIFQVLGDNVLGWDVNTITSQPPPNYNQHAGVNLEPSMKGTATSALVRMPFGLSDPDGYDLLSLKVKYDDGFVAYLNGVEVARRNAPADVQWNSAATASRDDKAAVVYEEIRIPITPGLLIEGNNTLAIQGLNVAADDVDFLVAAELGGLRITPIEPAYFSTPTPGAVNSTAGSQRVAEVNFSRDRGFYESHFPLTITTDTPGATIRYTLDGTAPTTTGGLIYSAPLWINKTTTIRAIAYKAGMLSSASETQTYLFPADILRQSVDGTPHPGLPGTWSPNAHDYGMDQRLTNPAPTTLHHNGFTYFTAQDALSGLELWRTNGTVAGTTLAANIAGTTGGTNAGLSSGPADLTLFQNRIFFRAAGNNGMELWSYNPATGTAAEVKDINPGAGASFPADLTVVNVGGIDVLFFTAYDSTGGHELWRSDGTNAGTVRVRDIVVGGNGSYPGQLTAVGSTLFFTATDGTNGYELWKSDGTIAGTVIVRNIASGSQGSFPTSLMAIGGTLYFAAGEPGAGTELWKSDGTLAGTAVVRDVYPGSASSYPREMTALGTSLLFVAGENTNGLELWKSDGTLNGTVLLKNIYAGKEGSSVGNVTRVGTTVYFSATDGIGGVELWKTDGTPDGTLQLKDIVPGGDSSNPRDFTVVGSTLYFTAETPGEGRELWKSDGTPAGTVRVVDLVPGATGSKPYKLQAAGTTSLVFAATGSGGATGIYKTDGTAATTTLLRAIKVDEGAHFSVDDLKSIPSFSVVMNQADLFGTGGIYSNASLSGRASEKQTSLELIYPDGRAGFQINGGIRLRGAFSRQSANPKHGFRFYFRSDYGSGKLEFPLFGENGAGEFDQFDLRTHQNYAWHIGSGDPTGIFLRDQLSRDLAVNQGNVGPKGNYYFLYVNGMFFGMFNSDERPEASFGEEYFGGRKEDYDTIKVEPAGGHHIVATDGNMEAWTEMWNQALDPNIGSLANYMKIQGRNPDGTRNPAYKELLDVDSLIDYMLVIFYAGNRDAPTFSSGQGPNNFFAIRDRTGDHGGFKFFVHDAEHTFLSVTEDRTQPWGASFPTGVGTSNPAYIFERLRAGNEFRLRVSDRINLHMRNGGALTPARVLEAFNKRIDEYDRAVVGESARWGDAKRLYPLLRETDWLAQVQRIGIDDPGVAGTNDSYIQRRTAIVVGQLQTDGFFTSAMGTPPTFGQYGGGVNPGFTLTIGSPAGGATYYTTDGSDPRLVSGTGGPFNNGRSAASVPYTGAIPVNRSMTVKARTLLNGVWTPLTEATFEYNLSALKVTELMYSPAPDTTPGSPYTPSDFEFIEFRNVGNAPLDLSGVRTTGVQFTFPAGTTLEPGARVNVVRNLAAFRSRYGDAAAVAGVWTGGLTDDGERITVLAPSPSDDVIQEFTFDGDWYDHAKGTKSDGAANPTGGYSLVVLNTGGDYSEKENWRPSNAVHGGPGLVDAGINPNTVIISEALTHTDAGLGDWIELRNTTNAPVDVSGWFLSDAGNDLAKFRIPAGTVIPADGFVTFSQFQHFDNPNHPGARIPFALSELGDEIYLSNADAQGNPAGYRDSVQFAASDREVTFGRVQRSTGGYDFTTLSAPTFNSANAQPLVGPVTINEVMYDPPTGGFEWIELRNLTGSVINLSDWTFTAGVTFKFPSGAMIQPYGFLIVTGGTPSNFRAAHGVSVNVPVYQWDVTTSLSNSGETVELSRPGVQDPGEPSVPLITVDKVTYQGNDPWPDAGDGLSIAKLAPTRYSADAVNWTVGPFNGTPAAANAQEAPTVDLRLDAVVPHGQNFSRDANFADTNPNQTWTATVNYGDGSPTQPLTLSGKFFTVSRQYANPGTYTVTVTVTDNAGGVGNGTMVVTVLPTVRTLTSAADTYTLRLDPSGAFTQFFESAGAATPAFSILRGLLQPFTINAGAGNDKLVVDLTYGNPLPDPGVDFAGGNGTGDSVEVRGSNLADAIGIASTVITVGLGGGGGVRPNGVEAITVDGRGGDDTIAFSGNSPLVPQIEGGEGSDTIELTPEVVAALTYNPGLLLPRTGSAGWIGSLINFAGIETVAAGSFTGIAVNTGAGADAFQFVGTQTPGRTRMDATADGLPLPSLVFDGDTQLTLNHGAGGDAIAAVSGVVRLTGLGANAALGAGGSATVHLALPMRVSSLTVGENAQLRLVGTGGQVLRTGSLGLSGAARLDLADNDLVVDFVGPSPIQQYRQWILDGTMNNPSSPSIRTTGSLPTPRTVAHVDNNLIRRAAWSGVPIAEGGNFNQIILTSAHVGDSNLDKVVNEADYMAVTSGMGQGGAQWLTGDVTHDGLVTAADFAAVTSNLGAGAPQGGQQLLTQPPAIEPTPSPDPLPPPPVDPVSTPTKVQPKLLPPVRPGRLPVVAAAATAKKKLADPKAAMLELLNKKVTKAKQSARRVR